MHCTLCSASVLHSGFCVYGLTCNALCHWNCLSECKTLSVAQWLSTRFSCGRPGFDIRTGRTLEVSKSNWEVSGTFVTTRANG